MTFAIDARHLRKEFGSKTAVSNLTIQVKKGEIFGFLGPNGAGKTTSVKMLLGLIAPTSGTASLLERPLGDRLARAKIGYLPEHFRFHEWLTAVEFLDLHGKLYHMSKSERKVAIPDMLTLVGLSEQADVQLKTFSKGMLQRIGLAQALINDPELLFLDEPTSGLDPMGRVLVRDVINKLRGRGTAVFLNSHLLSEVEKTCDRVTFIKHGMILETLQLNEFQADAVQVRLRVGNPSPPLLQALTRFGDEISMDKNGRIHLIIPNEAKLPRLAAWLIAEGHTLYELSPHRQSLEELFVQIMEGGE